MLAWSTLSKGLETRGRAALVTVLRPKGSTPREAGARMVVFADGAFSGTIGGGMLEYRVIEAARAMLATRDTSPAAFTLLPYALGPELGQCCGGRVEVAVELFGRDRLAEVAALAALEAAGPFRTVGTIGPDGVRRRIAGPADGPGAALVGGELHEAFGEAARVLYLFGAGHVGRALVLALAPLAFRVVWVDARPDAFPPAVPRTVTLVRPDDPVAALAGAPDGAFVLVMTHDHALDLAIVDAALRDQRFAHVGVIGSATKRARFESRLAALGHGRAAIERLVCPIGATGPASKDPAVIAAATAVELIVADETARAASAPAGARPRLVAAGGRER
ncbi:xanthine dehydrogenase accessory protein XdhC [Prosthecomicrobium sp. N25]|uniref:xanthine dehydrogenase accessory protein XdhC n=1 Tax=Prosthecomicrobium sp. N25 TaxID=3129254 RepID=UPI0030786922